MHSKTWGLWIAVLVSMWTLEASAQLSWYQHSGRANAISAGPGPVTGIIGYGSGNREPYYADGSDWVKWPSGAGVEVAFNSVGDPWLINDGGYIFRWQNNQWTQLPGRAKDISIASNGTVWIIGYGTGNRDLYYWDWNESTWVVYHAKAGIRVDAAADGTPYVVNASGSIFRINSTTYTEFPGAAKDISVGVGDQDLFIIGEGSGNRNIYRWDMFMQAWEVQPGAGIRLDVDGGHIWLINSTGSIFSSGYL